MPGLASQTPSPGPVRYWREQVDFLHNKICLLAGLPLVVGLCLGKRGDSDRFEGEVPANKDTNDAAAGSTRTFLLPSATLKELTSFPLAH